MRRVARAGLLGLLLPALGLAEACAAFALAHRAPAERDWAALGPAVDRVRRPGDLVVVSPRWAEPHARRALGDDAFPLVAVARSGSETFGRAIEVSVLGARAPELEAFREIAATRVGPFTIRELSNPAPERVLFDFVAALGPEHATVPTADGGACKWTERGRVRTGGLGGHPAFPRARFECPEGPYFHVAETIIADQDFLPRRCIWAHPPESGERVIRYAGVSLGERIVGHLGMYWMIERDGAGAPVTLTVRVAGEPIGSVRHEDGEGWKRFELSTEGHRGAEAATVELVVTTDDYTHRHVCLQAEAR